MRRIIFLILIVLIAFPLFAQPSFDLGIMGGAHISKLKVSTDGFESDGVAKIHAGAFARFSVDGVYIQPEAYFSKKGGDLNEGALETLTSFDYNTVDVPLLIGIYLIKKPTGNLRLMGGPVFSFLTDSDIKGDPAFTVEYFKDNYYGYQFGIGADIYWFTIDARYDHGSNSLYNHPSLESKNRTFMVSVGFKFL